MRMAQYTLIVGTKNWSSWSLRPYLVLRQIGVPFSEDVIALRHDSTTAEVQRRSPSGRVPLLKISEGGREHIIWDSLAICETLAERHPDAKLWPDDPFIRAEARAYAAEMHSGFPDLREQLSMEFVHKLPRPPLRDATKTQIARIIAAWMHALEHHSGSEGFLFGRFSIADCMYAPVVSRFRTYGIALPELARAYSERIWSLPAMRDCAADAQKEVDSGLA
jgi:glutathione S-transferase